MKIIKNWIEIIREKYFDEPSYCKTCDSCGEEGCCSPISCMYKCMDENKPKNCLFGKGYARDLHCAYLVQKSQLRLIFELREGEINQEEFLQKVDEEWGHIYEYIYEDQELPEELIEKL